MKCSTYVFLFGFLLFNSCAQLSLFQDGRTVGKNSGHVGITATAYGVPEEDDLLSAGTIPFGILHGSVGLKDKLDLQFSMSTALSGLIAPKWQVVGDRESHFALSLNPGLEFQPIFSNGNILFRTHFGAIASIHPKNKFAIFLEPKYIAQFYDKERFFFPGLSTGVKFPVLKSYDVSIGGSFFGVSSSRDDYETTSLIQAGVGVSYRF